MNGFDNYRGFEDLDEGLRKSTNLKEGLTCNDTKHNWFVCNKRYETVSALSEEDCNELIIDTLYNDFIEEGIIDEDYDIDKFCEDYEVNLAEAKYGMTEDYDGLKTRRGNILIRKANFVGELPFGYSVDEDGDLLNMRGRVVGEVKNKPDVDYTD